MSISSILNGIAKDLRGQITGELVLPGESGWDAARLAWNLAVDQHPAAVVFPESAADVAAVVELARGNGLSVAAQGTGHSAAPLGSLDSTILVKTSRLREVQIDGASGLARIGGGCVWGDVVPLAAEHGLAGLAGSANDVGVVGYSVGGGLGWLARHYGFACNSVRAAEVVTADGRTVRVAADNEPDLFWALRGGGGGFAIVTALEFGLYPVNEVYAGALFWPIERAAPVLHAWRELVADVPVAFTSLGRLLQFPPIPEVPDHLRGRAFAVVEAVYEGPEDKGAELLRPLRALGPEMDTFGTIQVIGLSELHMDPPEPVPGAGDGALLADLPAQAVDALVAVAGPGSGSTLVSVEVRHLGGALAQASPEHGALAALDAGFVLYGVGVAMNAEMKAAAQAHIAKVRDALADWDAGRSFLNFTEREADPAELFTETTYARLRQVKAQYDPENTIRGNHTVPPLA